MFLDYLLFNRKGLDLFFWVFHVCLAGLIVSDPELGLSTVTYWLIPIGLAAGLGYLISLGFFVRQFGKSPVIWCGVSILSVPLSYWASYYLSFKDLNKPVSGLLIFKSAVIIFFMLLFIYIVAFLSVPST